MAKRNRDEFTEKTKLQIAKRAGWLCSDPSCRRSTIGSNSDRDGEINLGLAAHICAAAPDGPRYDAKQSSEQRRSASNGIWMCRLHGASIDAKDSIYTVELLREWKEKAESDSWRRVLYAGAAVGAVEGGELTARIRAAAAADLEVFRRTEKWPSTQVALMVEVEGLNQVVGASVLANTLATLGDLVLVAPPGMGKTTALFQVAESLAASGNAIPIVVPLGDWSADETSLIELIRKRPAFRAISEDDLRVVATKSAVVILLDGWNELDVGARKRVRVAVQRLQAELPELGLLVSTRKQALDVPFEGKRVYLQPLNEKQQVEIAKALRGDAGVRVLDHAWRVAGVRELVAIPLYLTALLALAEGESFPTTKEEVLRRFVATHEKVIQHAEVVAEVTRGLPGRFLEGLATAATYTANTTIPDAWARKSVSETSKALVTEGQIQAEPDPHALLETLASHHVLVRGGDPPGYSFQHQQLQEWFASHQVERLMLASVNDAACNQRLKGDILNLPIWEEAILFACERLARGSSDQQNACGAAILAAFDVDPILAAEMIFRSTDEIWARIGPTIRQRVTKWHTPGMVDRAFRFMICSGRSDFLDQVWPLISHENEQVHLSALRAGKQFRPSILGNDSGKRLAGLSPRVRQHVLSEIASNSGMDGLDLAVAVAKDDPAPAVRAAVVESLAFRRADRHVAIVLSGADDTTFDLAIRTDLVDSSSDETVRKGLEAARARQQAHAASAYDRLQAIAYAGNASDLSEDVTAVISEMEIDKRDDAAVQLIYRMRDRYPRAIANGILERVREGRSLFYGSDDLVFGARMSLEEERLTEIALMEGEARSTRAEAAASALGPQAVDRMIETYLSVKTHLRDAGGRYDKVAGDRYHELRHRIAHTPGPSLVAAVQVRAAEADNEVMAELAALVARHPSDQSGRGRPFDADALAAVGALATEWGARMLASDNANRSQLASIATLMSHAPNVSQLPVLRRMLDEELRMRRAFRAEAAATGWRPGRAKDEASWVYVGQYQRAFEAIAAPETFVLMQEYLSDEHFGECAARVLALHWIAENEPGDSIRVRGEPDFSGVDGKRAARVADPAATSTAAEAIFGAIESMISDDATADAKKHAVALGVVAVRLPHGQRNATIQELLTLAPRRQRVAMLRNLILSGGHISLELVAKGVAEVFEAAKTEKWILTQSDGYELKDWLRLLPFADNSAGALAVIRDLPAEQRTPNFLEAIIASLAATTSEAVESMLFELAELEPCLYANYSWLNAALGRGTESAARRLVDLTATGKFNNREMSNWYVATKLASLIGEYPQVREHVYELLKCKSPAPGRALLAQAVAEAPDADGVVLLLKLEGGHKGAHVPRRALESVTNQRVPSRAWKNAEEVVPVPAVDLRRQLLSMTTDGGSKDLAARWLTEIDKIRDRFGAPESEPRHPDLLSGKAWPIIAADPDASEDGY